MGDAGEESNGISTERTDSVSLSPITCPDSSDAYGESVCSSSLSTM